MKKFLYILFTVLLFTSCKKLDFERENKVSKTEVKIQGTWVSVSATLIDIAEDGIDVYGHCWSSSHNPTIADFHSTHVNNKEKRFYTDTLLALEPDKKYYVRSYVQKDDEIIYGEESSFTAPNSISISCNKVEITAEQTIISFFSFKNIGSLKLSEYGNIISSNKADLINGDKRTKYNLRNETNFSETYAKLTKGETYYIQAYAKLSSTNIIYSNIVEVIIPKLVIETGMYEMLGSQQILVKGNICSLSFDAVTSYGFCWSSTTSLPNYNSEHIIYEKTPSLGEFEAQLIGLMPNQIFYYRAFATNGNTIVYGDVKTFKTN